MSNIKLHKSALADLELVWESDPASAAVIEALLQEAKANAAILDTFTIHKFGANYVEPYQVSRWAEQQAKGRNLWAIKIWELEDKWPKYRIVYAFHPQTHVHYVLGVFTRDFNYDEADDRTQRILAVYERLQIPEYK